LALVARVRHAIERHRLALPGETLVVGVSGGPDSLCLVHILRRLAAELSLELHISHLNHQMRGEDADEDAAFVARLAAQWNLPATVEAANVPQLARAHKMAPEEAARRARYTFLARVADRVGARTIAVAHSADDQTETLLMHWLRGSGLAGLRGMLPAIPMGDLRLDLGDLGSANADSDATFRSLTLIRPLLDVARADIEAYCAQHGLQPRFDRSNLDTTYFRNRLRHDLIPYLETYNVNVREVLRRSALVFAADYEFLREQLDVAWRQIVRAESTQAIEIGLVDWRALPLSLKRSTLREAIHRLRRALRNIDFVHVENAVHILESGGTGVQATLPQGLMLTIGYDTFTVADERYRDLPHLPLLLIERPVPVAVPGRTQLPESAWVLEAEVSPRSAVSDEGLASASGWQACLDSEVVGPLPILRSRRPGDRFRPFGMGGLGKRVNEFMINEKIPASWRAHIPLLVNQEGQIIWLCGWRPDERARVTDSTRQVVWLRFDRR
jgi:tRNA(Ile)-lysidine synthase